MFDVVHSSSIGADSTSEDIEQNVFRLFNSVHFNVEVLDTPLEGLLVGVEEYVNPVSAYGPTSVEDCYGAFIIITGDTAQGFMGPAGKVFLSLLTR